jgi:UTP--glucose-1-phosphate uridylyltransferase
VFLGDHFDTKNKKAVIPVAGLGTRMLPAAKAIPIENYFDAHYEPVAVLLPDVLVLAQESRDKNYCLSSMLAAWNHTGIGLIMVERVSSDAIQNYGVADLGAEAGVPVKGLVEKPSPKDAPSNLAMLGRYILPSAVLATVAGVGGEMQLTDALDELLKLDGLNAFETDAGVFDYGNKRGLLSANLAVGMRDPETKLYIKTLIEKSGW